MIEWIAALQELYLDRNFFLLLSRQSVMGRGLLEVRVCACPGRDSNLEDKQQKQPFRRKRRLPDETTGT